MPPSKQRYRTVKLANLNIQGLQHRTSRLKDVLQSKHALGKANDLDILALTETWQSNAEAYDYSTIKEYRWIGFPNEKNNRGTGFWISHKYCVGSAAEE